MEELAAIYRENFFSKRWKDSWRAPIFCEIVQNRIEEIILRKIDSVIDVGCAIGDFVQEWSFRVVTVKGIEGSEACLRYIACPSQKIALWDLRKNIESSLEFAGSKYDLVICIEVAEHIEEMYVDTFLDNLVYLGNRILLSAALPGEKGHHHVNCQKHGYWVSKMEQRGFLYDKATTKLLRDDFKKVGKRWFTNTREHLLLFERRK